MLRSSRHSRVECLSCVIAEGRERLCDTGEVEDAAWGEGEEVEGGDAGEGAGGIFWG